MAKNFRILKNIENMHVQRGTILCRYERKLWLAEEISALPIEYL